MAEPPDEVILFRTIWRDRDYDGDQLIPGKIFPRDDLKSPRYVSVDRHDLLNDAEWFARLKDSQKKAVDKGDFSRKAPEVAFLPCWEVRELRYDSESSPYLSVRDASKGFYESHCAILNVNTNPGSPSHNDIRRQLMDILLRYGVVPAFPSAG
jgi:hypothetical protein